MKSTFEKMGGTYTLGADGIYFRRAFQSQRVPNAQLVEKDFFDKLTALFRTLKRSEKWFDCT